MTKVKVFIDHCVKKFDRMHGSENISFTTLEINCSFPKILHIWFIRELHIGTKLLLL